MPQGEVMELFLYDSPAFKDFLQRNSHEAGEVRFLESIVEEGMNGIDIGANRGITSVVMAKRLKGGTLYAFEPVPEYAKALRENLSSNGLDNVVVCEQAITDQVGSVNFYRQGLSSGIIPEGEAKKCEVPTTTVDRFLHEEKIERIDLINMDCEGSELLVLRGAKETLLRDNVKIFCEIHHNFLKQLGQSVGDLVTYLHRLEFKVYGVSLDDLEVRNNNFDTCDYVYAYNQ
jgi:FkbM family methyltransferase